VSIPPEGSRCPYLCEVQHTGAEGGAAAQQTLEEASTQLEALGHVPHAALLQQGGQHQGQVHAAHHLHVDSLEQQQQGSPVRCSEAPSGSPVRCSEAPSGSPSSEASYLPHCLSCSFPGDEALRHADGCRHLLLCSRQQHKLQQENNSGTTTTTTTTHLRNR